MPVLKGLHLSFRFLQFWKLWLDMHACYASCSLRLGVVNLERSQRNTMVILSHLSVFLEIILLNHVRVHLKTRVLTISTLGHNLAQILGFLLSRRFESTSPFSRAELLMGIKVSRCIWLTLFLVILLAHDVIECFLAFHLLSTFLKNHSLDDIRSWAQLLRFVVFFLLLLLIFHFLRQSKIRFATFWNDWWCKFLLLDNSDGRVVLV